MVRAAVLVGLASVVASGCGPSILGRWSARVATGACTVVELGHDRPDRTAPPRRSLWVYDAQGRLVMHRYNPQYHATATVSYRRDAAGRLDAVDYVYDRAAVDFPCAREGGCYEPPVHARGRVEVRRDEGGRVTERVEQSSTGSSSVRRYRYDDLGRLVGERGEGEVRWGYADGPLPVSRSWDFSHGRGAMRFVYDAEGRLRERRTTSCLTICGDEAVERYEYDAPGRLVRIVHAETPNETTWTYDEAGRVLTRGDEHGPHSRFVYDDRGRVLSWRSHDEPLRDYQYEGDCARAVGPVETARPVFDVRAVTDEAAMEPVFP